MHSSVVKYHVRLKFDVEGVVEKADLIGAIFGQTEGLFGPEMNLNELQKVLEGRQNRGFFGFERR